MTRGTTALRCGLGALFIGASVLQRTHRDFFEALVPEVAAEHKDKIQGSMTGALAGLGACFLIPRLNPVARWGTTIALLGTLPAAVDQVRNPPQVLIESGIPPALVTARIPAQILVVALARFATREPRTHRRPQTSPRWAVNEAPGCLPARSR
ncbi:MAG: hypothetical protein ACK5MT_01285 [Actinomycetales bacterium]